MFAELVYRKGLLRELNPGPLAPEARIMPLDQAANWDQHILGYTMPWVAEDAVSSFPSMCLWTYSQNSYIIVTLMASLDCDSSSWLLLYSPAG